MAKIEWKAPIEAVHGKLFAGFGAAKRKAANAKGEQFNYSTFYGTRDYSMHPLSEDEQSARTKFGAIAKLVGQRRKNATKRMQDAAGFAAQTAIPTLTKYIWSVAKAEYQASLQNA